MELPWYDINLRQPNDKHIGKELIVTVYNPLWEIKYQSMVMIWDVEVRSGIKAYTWKLSNGSKVPSTWEVTDWMEFPPPSRKDE